MSDLGPGEAMTEIIDRMLPAVVKEIERRRTLELAAGVETVRAMVEKELLRDRPTLGASARLTLTVLDVSVRYLREKAAE